MEVAQLLMAGAILAALVFIGVGLKRLHEDNVIGRSQLRYDDEHVTRKVEEQNMHLLTSHLKDHETAETPD